jgi:hypothetical protein
VLRRIFGPKRDEVTEEWRKLYNEELNGLCCSPRIVRVMKSRIIRWVGHVVRMGMGKGVYRFLWGTLREIAQWGDPGLGARIILERIFRKWDVGV